MSAHFPESWGKAPKRSCAHWLLAVCTASKTRGYSGQIRMVAASESRCPSLKLKSSSLGLNPHVPLPGCTPSLHSWNASLLLFHSISGGATVSVRCSWSVPSGFSVCCSWSVPSSFATVSVWCSWSVPSGFSVCCSWSVPSSFATVSVWCSWSVLSLSRSVQQVSVRPLDVPVPSGFSASHGRSQLLRQIFPMQRRTATSITNNSKSSRTSSHLFESKIQKKNTTTKKKLEKGQTSAKPP